MYSVIVYTGNIIRESDGLIFTPNDNNPVFQDYQSWLLSGNSPTLIKGEPVSSAKIRLCAVIDSKSDFVYTSILSSPGKLQEYVEAESEALAFNATGVLGPNVEIWAQVNGWTSQQAVDSILAAATKFRQALSGIRSVRLGAKATLKGYSGTSVPELEQICSSFVAQLDAIYAMLMAVVI